MHVYIHDLILLAEGSVNININAQATYQMYTIKVNMKPL